MAELVVFDRRKNQQEHIDDHVAEIKRIMEEQTGVSKAMTILIDESSGQWRLHPVYCNMTNGDVFMSLKLLEHRLVDGVQYAEEE